MKSSECVPVKGGHQDTATDMYMERAPCKHDSRVQDDTPTSQKNLRLRAPAPGSKTTASILPSSPQKETAEMLPFS